MINVLAPNVQHIHNLLYTVGACMLLVLPNYFWTNNSQSPFPQQTHKAWPHLLATCQSSKTCMLALACLLLNLFTTIIMCSGCGQTKIIKFTTAMLLSYWSVSTKWQPLLAASLLWPISGL